MLFISDTGVLSQKYSIFGKIPNSLKLVYGIISNCSKAEKTLISVLTDIFIIILIIKLL